MKRYKLIIAAMLLVFCQAAYAAGIKDYSTTASSNTALFPEGMDPSDVNDGMRQVQADIRSDYQDYWFRDLGDTPTFVDTDTFTVTGDQTAFYIVNQRIRLVGSGAMGTIYATISASVFSSITTVDVTLDSASIDNTLTNVLPGIDPTNDPIPNQAVRGSAVDINGETSATIVAADELIFADVSDSNNNKKDTTQGILDLVAADLFAKTEVNIAVGDSITLYDLSNSDAPKTDTVQGVLDLVAADLFSKSVVTVVAGDSFTLYDLSNSDAPKTDTVQGILDLISGVADVELNQDGFIEFDNGLIINWGTDTFPSTGNTNITLSKAYTTTHYAAFASQGITTNISANWFAIPTSLTQIKIGSGATGGAGSWLSIGR